MPELFDTLTLAGMIEPLDRPNRFIFERFFNTAIITFDTEEILFDRITSSRKIAPYVSPLVAGKAQKLRGSTARTFRPAYVKPKAAVNPGAVVKRRPGEAIAGGLSPEERYTRIIIQELEDQDAQIARREELMAIEILTTGKLVVESADFPRMELDFGRDPTQTITLLTTARWGESGVSPLANIKAWASTVHTNSGTHPGQVIMDPKAAELFLGDDPNSNRLFQILDNRRQVSGSMELAGQVTGAQGIEAVFIGSIGQFEFWQYQATYQDETGVIHKMMPDYSVLMCSAGVEGYACYGAIMDLDSLQAVERFPKMWTEKDPSVAMLMTQSAPLPVPARIDGSVFAKVR